MDYWRFKAETLLGEQSNWQKKRNEAWTENGQLRQLIDGQKDTIRILKEKLKAQASETTFLEDRMRVENRLSRKVD